jgi:WD repeat-containing protein 89
VCISNADEDDEDEAVMYVGNLGSSIGQAGWIPHRTATARTGVWAATDMETFSLWSDEVRRQCTAVSSSLKKTRLFLTGFLPHQLDLKNDLDIRSPSLHTGVRTWVTDYLVGCHASEESGLNVLVGSNEYVSLYSVTPLWF